MKRLYWIALLCALLGVAGYLWFEHWYGWLTAAGSLAIRIGPIFVWRVVLRIIRRQIIKGTFDYLPSFIKRPVRRFGKRLAGRISHAFSTVVHTWRHSWKVRLVVIVPVIVLLGVLAYDAEGFVEFLYLFPIPFLFTAIFPQGFWMLLLGYIMQLLAAHGLESVAEKLLALLPEDSMDGYRAGVYRAREVLANTTRPVRVHLTRWKRRTNED